jgi:hypothetical protein
MLLLSLTPDDQGEGRFVNWSRRNETGSRHWQAAIT